MLREEQKAADHDSDPEPEPDPQDYEDEVRLQLAEAEAAAAAAEDQLELGQLREERALTSLERLEKPSGVDDPGAELAHWREGIEEKYDWGDKFPEKERRRRQKQLDHYVKVRSRYNAMRSAKLDAWAEADGKQRYVEFFKGRLERVMRVGAEVSAANAEARAAHAELEATRARLDELVRTQERARTRVWLESEAERV